MTERQKYLNKKQQWGLALLTLVGIHFLAKRISVSETFSDLYGDTLSLEVADSTEILLNETTSHYSFDANTIPEIRELLYSQGPVSSDGERAMAMTTWEIWLTWEMFQSSNECILNNKKVHLDIDYMYPHWNEYSKTDIFTKEAWDDLYHLVTSHESHHGKIAYICAKDLVVLLDEFIPNNSCVVTEEQLNKLIQRHYAKCNTQQNEYDMHYGRNYFPVIDLRPNSGR